ncbi:MAG: hypothetical protein ACP5IM_07625 [Candidatus Bathyarchaeia archaeon]
MREILLKRNRLYYQINVQSSSEEEKPMNAEIKELNRIICKQCDERDYEKCRNCKIHQLINKIASRS